MKIQEYLRKQLFAATGRLLFYFRANGRRGKKWHGKSPCETEYPDGKGKKSGIKKGKRMYMTHKFLIYMLFLAKNDIFAKRIG